MSDVEQATERLRRVLVLTPEPPRQPDPDIILSECERVFYSREEELAGLRTLLESSPTLLKGNRECRTLRDKIALLDRQWSDALDWARQELAKQRLAGQRARQAQRAYR